MTGILQAYNSTKSNEELQNSININVKKLKLKKLKSCEYVQPSKHSNQKLKDFFKNRDNKDSKFNKFRCGKPNYKSRNKSYKGDKS